MLTRQKLILAPLTTVKPKTKFSLIEAERDTRKIYIFFSVFFRLGTSKLTCLTVIFVYWLNNAFTYRVMSKSHILVIGGARWIQPATYFLKLKFSWKKNPISLITSYACNEGCSTFWRQQDPREIFTARISGPLPGSGLPMLQSLTVLDLQAEQEYRWSDGDTLPLSSSTEKCSFADHTVCNMICEWWGESCDWLNSRASP